MPENVWSERVTGKPEFSRRYVRIADSTEHLDLWPGAVEFANDNSSTLTIEICGFLGFKKPTGQTSGMG